jgi:hypothetical protein
MLDLSSALDAELRGDAAENDRVEPATAQLQI